MVEMLWSDPQPMMGRAASKRGVGVAFGPDVTHTFLDNNNLSARWCPGVQWLTRGLRDARALTRVQG